MVKNQLILKRGKKRMKLPIIFSKSWLAIISLCVIIVFKGAGIEIFKYKYFDAWLRSEKIAQSTLVQAITEIENGLFEANLGSCLYKKRIAKKGRGKRGGYRTIIAFRCNDKAIFMYGFDKQTKDNIEIKEKNIYKKLAKIYLNSTAEEINKLIKLGELAEVIL